VTTDDVSWSSRRDEVDALLRELKACEATAPDSPSARVLRDRVAEEHLPLVRYLARRFSNRTIPMDDLVQVGSIGLLKAIDRFDIDRGVSFASFAAPTIIGEIKRHFRDAGWLLHVPRRAKELQTSIDRARAELSQLLNRAPTVAELVESTGLDQEAVVEALDVARSYAATSLDLLVDPDAGPAGSGVLAERDEGMENVELRAVLLPALATLSERDQRILMYRFAAGKSQTEIARLVGVSQMQVSRVIAQSLTRLRTFLGAETLSDLELG
jgi:RNA polymerase sigma-B factor